MNTETPPTDTDKTACDTNLFHRLFVAHPMAAGECYWRHLWFALTTGVQMIFFAICLILHGLFPFLCEKTASNFICKLYTTIEARRQKLIDCALEKARNRQ